MKKKLVFLFSLLFITRIFSADWTILNYIQSDNNLFNYVLEDISEMAIVGSDENLNLLVQVDTPENNGTWRYKVEKGRIDLIAHLQSEMGINPGQEIIDSANWGFVNYPANKHMLVLSGHGYGIIDPQLRKFKSILFDDSQNSYLNNQQLATALNSIKTNILGKKINILGMDACLMAMFEVGYQVKDSVEYFVASEESESAQGWNYSGFLTSLANGSLSSLQLAQQIVYSYDSFYSGKNSYYTQSAINLSNFDLIKNNINAVISKLNECKSLERSKILGAINAAKRATVKFSVSDYVDLHSFYSNLYMQINILSLQNNLNTTPARPTFYQRPRRGPEEDFFEDFECDEYLRRPRPTNSGSNQNISPRPTSNPRPTIGSSSNVVYSGTRPSIRPIINQQVVQPAVQPKTEFEIKIGELKELLTSGMSVIINSVVANVTGNDYRAAKGISIYCPQVIHSSYYQTQFAQDSLWLDFLINNR